MTTLDGYIRGPVRTPVNAAANAKGSIHDDATAQKLGFRGGTVAGSIHMDQFPPLLVEAFGPQWFETGSLSLNFRNATTGGEPVVGFVAAPPVQNDVQVAVRMEREDGMLVAEGTASVGKPAEESHLHTIDLRPSPPSELRMLEGVNAGDPLGSFESAIDGSAIRARIERGGLTEPLDWYTATSPWGGPIANPSAIVQLLYAKTVAPLGSRTGGAVGLFGAIEIRFLAGPVLVDTPYSVAGTVAAVGASPKTEYVWFDSVASRADDGVAVASMRMQLRWMKASAPAYQKG